MNLPIFKKESYSQNILSVSAENDINVEQQLESVYHSVTLNENLKKEYEMLYQSDRKYLYELIKSIHEIGVRCKHLFDFLYELIERARQFDVLDPEVRKSEVKARANLHFNRIENSAKVEKMKGLEVTEGMQRIINFLSRAHNGVVIKPSTKYKDGVDIMYIGGPTPEGNIVKVNDFNKSSLWNNYPESEASVQNFEEYRLSSLETELSQKVFNAARAVIKNLFGSVDVLNKSSVFNKEVNNISPDFDFESLGSLVIRELGYDIPNFFTNIPKANYSKDHVKNFFSIAICRTADSKLAERYHTKRKSTNMNISPDLFANDYFVAFQDISFGLTMSLKKEFAEYITQSENGYINYGNLYTWISNWTPQYFSMPGKNIHSGVQKSAIPRYVTPISKSLEITKKRKEIGMYLEEGKSDDYGIYIGNNGGLQYLPKQSERNSKNSEIYEKAIDEYYRIFSEKNVSPSYAGLNSVQFKVSLDFDDVDKYSEVYNKVKSTHSKVLHYDWDYNTIIRVSNTGSIVTEDINGSAYPDSVTIADYLGFDFSEEGENKIQKPFYEAFMLMNGKLPTFDADKYAYDSLTASAINSKNNRSSALDFLRESDIKHIIDLYAYFEDDKLPSFSELAEEAKSEIDSNAWSDLAQSDYYQIYIDKLTGDKRIDNIYSIISASIFNAGSSTMSATVIHINKNNPDLNYSDLPSYLEDSEYYFELTEPAPKLLNFYRHLGGMVLFKMCDYILKLNKNELFDIESDDLDNKRIKPSFSSISRNVIPSCIYFTKYVPNYKRYYEEAETQIEKTKPDDSIGIEDIKIEGGKEGAFLIPHQLEGHKRLRGKPKFAVLDIGAGGGKTSITITDIMSCRKELSSLFSLTAVVICPDNLIKNWVQDTKLFSDKWNVIPLNTKIINRWGFQRMAERVKNAPPNTITVAGMNMLKANKLSVTIGPSRMNVSLNMELLRMLGYNYIAIDESHKMKKKTSLVHKMGKTFTTGSHVLFLRILSATIVHDKLKDIEGQTALYNAHIFREREFASNLSLEDAQLKQRMRVNNEDIPSWEVETPQQARERLSRYCSLVSFKKKHWAYLLPNPIERFFGISMENTESTDPEEIENDRLHQEMYDIVLSSTLEEMQEFVKRKKASNEDSEDEEDVDEEEDDFGEVESDVENDGSILSEADVKRYMQRIERLIIDPQGDELYSKVFGNKKYISRKARFIAEKVKSHFDVKEWSRATKYKEYDLVRFEGKTYVARKQDESNYKSQELSDDTIGKSPVSSPELWKEEPEGKCLVICRYVRSINAIYDALDPETKAKTVRYHGQLPSGEDKADNLDSFIKSDKIQVIIANEVGISEGHNLQMASRLIRAEAPWGPGEVEQTLSRIFRPDPMASKSVMQGGEAGELYRAVVFLDTVLADGTMEVAKQARLISKIFNAARFDEAGNTEMFSYIDPYSREQKQGTYSDILDNYHLPSVPLDMETLASRNKLSDETIAPYISGLAQLNGIQRQEFHDMRKKLDTKIKLITPLEAPSEFKKIDVPFISGQKAPDMKDGLKYITVKEYINSMLSIFETDFENTERQRLINTPILTDRGKGVVVGYRASRSVVDGKIVNPVGNIKVALVDGGQYIVTRTDFTIAFVPKSVSKEQIEKEFMPTNTNQQVRQDTDQEQIEENKDRSEAERRITTAQNEEQQVEVRNKTRKRAQKRRENIKVGKPINSGIGKEKEPTKDILTKVDYKIELHPAVYHDFLVLECDLEDPDAKTLVEKHNFKLSGSYVYAGADRWPYFDKILDYIESRFYLSPETIKRLEAVIPAFPTKGKQMFKAELAPSSELPYFFATRKRMVTNPEEVRVYPIISPTEVQLAIDYDKNPAIRKHVGKAIRGTGKKWQLSEGNALYFARNKTDMRNKIKELSKVFTITNERQLEREINSLQTKRKHRDK